MKREDIGGLIILGICAAGILMFIFGIYQDITNPRPKPEPQAACMCCECNKKQANHSSAANHAALMMAFPHPSSFGH